MDARINSILEQKGIHADGDGLHLLPPDQLAQSQQLQSETKEFLEKTKAFKQLHELELKPNSPFGALRVVATNLLANPHSRDDTPVKSLTWFGCESEV